MAKWGQSLEAYIWRAELGIPNPPAPRRQSMNLVDEIIAYESGELTSEEEIIDFFQKLIDSGLAWKLQGSYGRMAMHLINNGFCNPRCPTC